MGKKHRHRRGILTEFTPDFNNPVCPTCGRFDKLVDESADSDPMYECTRCWVRFMFEDSSKELVDSDEDAAANINSGVVKVLKLKCALCSGRGCEVCTKKKKKEKDDKIRTEEPQDGDCEEITNAVGSRS